MSEPHSDQPLFAPAKAPPPRKRPAWRTVLWVLLVLAVAAGIAWWLTPHAGKTGPGARGGHGGSGRGGFGAGGGGRRPATTVGTAKAVKGDIPIELDALGTVTPPATVTVRARLAGTLVRVNFREGQMVREGQVLAEVDARPYVIALQQAQGQLMRDEAALANARLDLQRYQTLLAQDSVAKQVADTQAAMVKSDEGVVMTDNAAVASARLNIAYCKVIAPISGRVGLRQVDVGNYVSTGDANGVVVLTQIDPIDVVFSLPEDNVPRITARMASGAVLPVTAFDRTGATQLAAGTLSTLDNQIDVATGTVKAKARFANGTGSLFPNQFVNTRLLVDTLKDAVIVPASAVRHGSQGDYVYILEDDHTASVRQVKVGPAQGERASIASGVQVGETVITEGGDKLRDGSTVVLAGDKPQATGGGGGWGGGSGGHGGWQGGGGGGGRMARMTAALNLDAQQQAKATAIFAAARAKAGDDPAARRAAMRDAMTQLEPILRPDQKAKLAEMRSHMGGGGRPGGSGQ